MRRIHVSVAMGLAVLASAGCDRKAEAAAGGGASAPPVSSAADPGGGAPAQASVVARIVFVDKENCCDCTRRRTDGSWAAMQAAIAGREPAIPVERLHMDTQADLAAPYQAMQPIMVPPALYFLRADGTLVTMLQGEITAEQIGDVLR